jgi:hypothetical protein
LSAEGGADADLPRSLRDDPGEYAVNADRIISVLADDHDLSLIVNITPFDGCDGDAWSK